MRVQQHHKFVRRPLLLNSRSVIHTLQITLLASSIPFNAFTAHHLHTFVHTSLSLSLLYQRSIFPMGSGNPIASRTLFIRLYMEWLQVLLKLIRLCHSTDESPSKAQPGPPFWNLWGPPTLCPGVKVRRRDSVLMLDGSISMPVGPHSR